MSSFCEYCGNRVEPGMMCMCPDAQKSRSAAGYGQPQPPQQPPQGGYAPPPPQGAPYGVPQQPPQGGYAPPPPQGAPYGVPQQPPQGGYAPPPPQGAPYGAPQQPYGQPPYGYAPPRGPGAMGQMRGTLSGFIKDPMNAARNFQSLSSGVIWLLLLAEVAAFGLMILFMALRLGLGGYAFGGMFGGFLIIAVQVALMLVCILLCSKIFKGSMPSKAIIASLSIASVPWTAAWIVIGLLSLIGITNSFVAYMIMMVFIFAMVSSIALLDTSMHGLADNGYHRMLILSISYSVQFLLFMLIIGWIAQAAVTSAMNSMPGGFGGMFGGFGGYGSFW